MESHLTVVLDVIAACMASSGLKKALSFRAVEPALRWQRGRDLEEKSGRASAAHHGSHRDVAFQRVAVSGSWKLCRVDECNSEPPSKFVQ